VSGYLLDTNVALLATLRSSLLSVAVRNAIKRGPVFLSAISYWEVLLKSMKGKLDVGDPRTWWSDVVAQLAAMPIALRPEHVEAIYYLKPIHADPFDRALIAQATVEGLALVTIDTEIGRYASERFSVVS
jgi:PIN domain nuclease of toxin-antitoxin system